MRNRFLVGLGIIFVLLFFVGLRVVNDSLERGSILPRFFLSQVSPGPNQALFFYQPSSGTFAANSNFVVDMRVNSSAAITSVKAYLVFDPARISAISIDSSQSAFPSQWEQTFDNTVGIVRLQRSTPAPGLSGDKLIARITFQTKSVTGSATLGYDANCFSLTNPSCLVLKPDDINILASSPTGSYTIDGTPPSPPTSVSYAPNPNNTGTHTVSWSGASDTGGSGVASYEVRRSSNGGGSWSTAAVGVTATSFTEPSAISDGTYIYQVRAVDGVGNVGAFSSNTNTVRVDKIAPVQSGHQPIGQLSAGTTSATLSLNTNEQATCRYSNTDQAYNLMPLANTFSATDNGNGTFTHTIQVLGLSNGNSYSYFVRCSDTLSNANSASTPIEFSVAASSPGPDTVAPNRSNGSPSGVLTAGTTSATLSLNTNESAACRYATAEDVLYNLMPLANTFSATDNGNGTFTHTIQVLGLSNGNSYSYFVRCSDTVGNSNATDFPIQFQIGTGDTVPPVLSKLSPSGTLSAGTTSATLSLETDENATCRYSTSPGIAWSAMPSANTFAVSMNSDGTFAHAFGVSSLSNGNSYSYFVRCSDTVGNSNATDSQIQLSVAAPPPPPGGGGAGGSPPPSLPAGGGKGDCNSDSKVNIFDLSILISNWRKATSACDLNGDQTITIVDLSIMLSNWAK